MRMRPALGQVSERALQEYGQGHQHPVNRACHAVGIPLVAASVVTFGAAAFASRLWLLGTVFLGTGGLFQFVGHAVEGTAPAFLRDWRFLLVGLHWWVSEVRAVGDRAKRRTGTIRQRCP